MPEEQTDTQAAPATPETPQASLLRAAREILEVTLPGAVVGTDPGGPEGALLIAAEQLVAAVTALRDDDRLQYRLPLFVTAVDWLDRDPRFDLVYQLRSLKLGNTIRLKVGVADNPTGLPSVPSLTPVFKGMLWLEREVYDLFGVDFDGHPDQRRLMMPADWEGHPLRKDYVSFGEPVKFTDRRSFPPDAAVPTGGPH